MTEAPATVSARIIGIDPGGMMSTIWTFTYLTTEGDQGTFHADHRPARNLCEGLESFALEQARAEQITLPQQFLRRDRRGLLCTFVNVELVPDETMGMMMPMVNPVSLDVERLKQLIEKASR